MTIQFSNSTSEHVPKYESKERVFVHSCSQPYCSQQPGGGSNPNVHRWMNGHIECTAYIEWNIIQPLEGREFSYATTWMNLEDSIVSKPVTGDKYSCDHSYMWYLLQPNAQTRRRLVPRVWRKRGNGELLLNRCRFSVWEDEKVKELDGGTMWLYLIALNYTLKNGHNVKLYVCFSTLSSKARMELPSVPHQQGGPQSPTWVILTN